MITASYTHTHTHGLSFTFSLSFFSTLAFVMLANKHKETLNIKLFIGEAIKLQYQQQWQYNEESWKFPRGEEIHNKYKKLYAIYLYESIHKFTCSSLFLACLMLLVVVYEKLGLFIIENILTFMGAFRGGKKRISHCFDFKNRFSLLPSMYVGSLSLGREREKNYSIELRESLSFTK